MALTFIKLDINLLNDSKIKFIRNQKDGDKIFVLWIGLLCLAMKSNQPGYIEIAKDVPFTDELLSSELGISKDIICNGLVTLQQLKMVEKTESGTYFILNFEKHQSLDKIIAQREKTRKRVQKYRKKKKNKDKDVTGYSDMRNADVTQQTKTKTKTKTKDVTNSNEFRLSLLLYERIKARDTKYKQPNLIKWTEHIDKLIRIDKRTVDEIEQVINWSQENEFWKNNILSTEKLRKQFSTLYLQKKAEEEKTLSNQPERKEEIFIEA